MQRDHPELGALVTIYWRSYHGNEGETSLAFEDVSIKTGTNEKEAREAPETSYLYRSASPNETEMQEMWIEPLQELPAAEYRTPYPKIAIGTFAPGRAVLRDVSWGGRSGGAFNKKGTTTLTVPEGVHPTFAILSPPASIYVEGQGRIEIDTGDEITSDGYHVPVISDLHAAMVFPLDLATINLIREGPRIKDYTYQLRGNFDLLGWVPIEDVQIVSVLTGEVTRPPPTAEQELFERAVAGPRPPFVGGRGPAGPAIDKDVLRFSNTGEEVTVERLVAWANRNHPRGLDDPTLLAPILHSHEFSGSDDAREMAAEALVFRLRERSKGHMSQSSGGGR
jgi:hypothetical protein